MKNISLLILLLVSNCGPKQDKPESHYQVVFCSADISCLDVTKYRTNIRHSILEIVDETGRVTICDNKVAFVEYSNTKYERYRCVSLNNPLDSINCYNDFVTYMQSPNEQCTLFE